MKLDEYNRRRYFILVALSLILAFVWIRSAYAPGGGYGSCGDGYCDSASGETCESCPEDCSCPEEGDDDSNPGGGSCKTCEDFSGQCGIFDNGCGGTIECTCPSGYTCENGTCVKECTPKTCEDIGAECGTFDDGCGGTINCGSCPSGYECKNGKCEPLCEEKCWCNGSMLVCQHEDCSTESKYCKYGCLNGECIEDTQAPITTINIVNDGWYANPVYVSLSCYDAISGCEHTYYCYDTKPGCKPNKEGKRFSISCPGGEVCKYYVRFYSVDKEGNEEHIKSVSFRIDNAKPEVEYTGSTGTVEGKAKISFSCKDEGSGCAAIKYRLDNSSWRTYANEFYVSDEGAHVIKFYAVDKVGNESERKQTSFTIINPLETLEIYNVRVLEVKAHSAKIMWETSVEAYGEVLYGTTKSLGLSKKSSFGTLHEVLLDDLEEATTYYFKVRAWNSAKSVETEILEFSTLYENFQIKEVLVKAFTSHAEVSWFTTVASECELFYKLTYDNALQSVKSEGISHQVMLQDLEPDSSYWFEIVCKRGAEAVRYEGSFITSEVPAKPAITEIIVEPSAQAIPEGYLVKFIGVLTNVEEASYEWNFGDGTKEEGTISESNAEGTEIRRITTLHAFYLEEEDEKIFEVKLKLIQEGKVVDEKSVSVVVTRAYIKAVMLEPKYAAEKSRPVTVKIKLLDKYNNPVDSSRLTYLQAYVLGNKLDLKEEEAGVFKGTIYEPYLRINNIEFVTVKAAAPVEGALRELSTRLAVRFRPLELKIANPFANERFYLGSKLGTYRFAFMLNERIPATYPYLSAKLVSKHWEKNLDVTINESFGNAVYVDINHVITEEDVENGLAILLEGQDAYGNQLSAKIDIPIEKENPLFDIVVVAPREKVLEVLKEKNLVVRINSIQNLKGKISVQCNGISGYMKYDEKSDLYYFPIKLPATYNKDELHCKIFGTAINADAADVEEVSFTVLSALKIEFIQPKSGEQARLAPIDEIKIKVRYANNEPLAISELKGTLIVDDESHNITLKKENGFYVAKLPKAIDFGEHKISLKLEEPLKGEKTAYVKINKALKPQEVLLALAIIFASALFVYFVIRVVLKIKDARALLLHHRKKLIALLKKTKAEYFKRHISESEFRKRYEKAKKELREVERKLKRKEYLFFWRKL